MRKYEILYYIDCVNVRKLYTKTFFFLNIIQTMIMFSDGLQNVKYGLNITNIF